jgi:hypothetical protein
MKQKVIENMFEPKSVRLPILIYFHCAKFYASSQGKQSGGYGQMPS